VSFATGRVKGYAPVAAGMRAFVSVDCDPIADEIRAAQRPLRGVDGLRPVDPENAHVTLKFLGDVADDRLPALDEALSAAVESADVSAFDLELAGYGAFPSRDYISVVWLGVRTGSEAVTRLYEAVEERTVDLGFDSEDHEFTPHVTVARMDHAGGKERVQEMLERDPTVGRMRVESVRLTESTLADDGPVYDTVARYPLADG
jgi:2'-5' RNA ligase